MTDRTDPDSPEPRDDATFSMFGDEDTGAADAGYQVLARKYRPKLFSDLIGQEAMVHTLENAFKTGRIAHAFMLTGVRGVGKTTTARLLARGLNYARDGVDQPSIALDPPGDHCQAIMESRHPDVLELDAASRTGVADMRDLLDGVRYSPVSARFKVYIIDEVHMLSTAAFNALLKTLEEPPAHVKFIFATTEIRKVPVTVLSRCQRFDLKRLDAARLAGHLSRIAKAEGADVSEEGLALIARAAEGSVRDGLSILDQAIVQAEPGTPVAGEAVRDMLGLGDRARLLDAFEMMIRADGASAIAELSDQVSSGADPLVLLKDLLDICADVATAQAAPDYTPPGPEDWAARTKAMAQSMSAAQAGRYWQMLLSGYQSAQVAPDSAVALRMIALRIAAAAGLPSPEDAARLLAAGGGAAGAAGKPDARPAGSGPVALSSFEDVVALLDAKREAILSGEVEAYLRPASFALGHIACAVKDGAPPDILKRLSDFLGDQTGLEWRVDPAAPEAGETLRERAARVQAEKIDAAAAHPAVAKALAALPGATIVDVRQDGPLEAGSEKDNVHRLDTGYGKTG
ncbi:MAG: DNA polymerase III subunit gamma/tau [Pseudomonadota bacterium]